MDRLREGAAAGALLVAFCVMCGFIFPHWWLRQYAALVATAIAVIATAGLRDIPAPDRDKTPGDLAYPYLLLHHLVGLLISIPTALPRGWTLFVLTTPITLLLSHAVVRYVERPIQRVRLQLRRPRSRALASGWRGASLSEKQQPCILPGFGVCSHGDGESSN